MKTLPSQINPGTDAVATFFLGLDAAFVGSTDTSILRFQTPAVGNPEVYVVSDSAETGTIIDITKSGLYRVSVRLRNSGGVTVLAAVSMNTNAGGLTTAPSWGTVGVQDFQIGAGDDAGGNPSPLNLDALIKVDGAALAAGRALGGQGARIRVHGTLNGGGAPAGLDTGNAALPIRRVAPVF